MEIAIATETHEPGQRRRDPATLNHKNRGWKPVYPHQVMNGLLDIRAIRREEEGLQKIEEMHTAAGNAKAASAARKAWNLAEKFLDARLDLMGIEAESHEAGIRGSETEQCRRYEQQDPSVTTLRVMCGGECGRSGAA